MPKVPLAENSKQPSLRRVFSWGRAWEEAIRLALFGCALLSVLTTVSIICILTWQTIQFFRVEPEGRPHVTVTEFLTAPEWTPSNAPEQQHFGIRPLVIGTFMVAGIASLIGLPLGLASAVYLSEYASPRFRGFVKPTLEMLAGIPTVVYGYFALLFLTPFVLKPVFQGLLGFHVDTFNALAGGITVGIMILPMVSSLSEDVLRSVPRGLREAAYALGSTKFDVSVRVVLPAALSGILASCLLALSRAVGETMAVTIAVGQNATGSFNPLETTETMTAFIVDITGGETSVGTVQDYSLYAVAASLFLITLATNVVAQLILRRFREVYH